MEEGKKGLRLREEGRKGGLIIKLLSSIASI